MKLLFALLLPLALSAQDRRPVAPAAQDEAAEVAACEALAGELQSAFAEGTLADLEPLVDFDALAAKGTGGIDCEEQFRKGFLSGVRETLLPTFHKSLRDALDAGGELSLLRVRKSGAERRLLLRMLVAEGGVSYFEFAVARRSPTRLVVTDWFPYTSGEWLSDTLHHLFLPFAVQSQRNLLDRLLGKDQLMIKHWDVVSKISDCVKDGKWREGLELCARLPDELRHDKFVLLQRLHLVTGHTEDEEYMHVLEDLRRYYPDDPSNDLLSIDYFFIRKQFKRAVESVRRLRASIEGDFYLDYLEGTLEVQAGDLQKARAALERSLEGEPGRIGTHWMFVTVCLRQKDNPAVLAGLKRIDELFEPEWNDLSQQAEYKDFAASPQHAEWLAYLAAKKK